MTVRRTLPQRGRTFVGAWCFVDHYGPNDVTTQDGMSVAAHPHTGLQTVSWLFEGEIEHRDSAGNHAMVLPGEMNLMTAGRGISHSEYSTPDTRMLHGAQLWLALPDGARQVAPAFEHYAPEAAQEQGWSLRVFLGEMLGQSSPVTTHSALFGAELRLDLPTTVVLPTDESYEYGVLVDAGDVTVNDVPAARNSLAYVAPGEHRLKITSRGAARLLVLGGEPFGEEIVMWWNFIGRSHEEIIEFRQQWQVLLEKGTSERFALPDADPRAPIPAPMLPNARLKSRA
ncbi:MAG: pirin [Marmoricola sp.]|jgi:redox-sensitive bicupin YhaK (pirin superfamily)|nr:pirin [Marmoricola sp.]